MNDIFTDICVSIFFLGRLQLFQCLDIYLDFKNPNLRIRPLSNGIFSLQYFKKYFTKNFNAHCNRTLITHFQLIVMGKSSIFLLILFLFQFQLISASLFISTLLCLNSISKKLLHLPITIN